MISLWIFPKYCRHMAPIDHNNLNWTQDRHRYREVRLLCRLGSVNWAVFFIILCCANPCYIYIHVWIQVVLNLSCQHKSQRLYYTYVALSLVHPYIYIYIYINIHTVHTRISTHMYLYTLLAKSMMPYTSCNRVVAQGLIWFENMVSWIEICITSIFICDVITSPCLIFSSSLTKTRLKLRHE